jgi:transcriptional regulator with XRE-family HTH domain
MGLRLRFLANRHTIYFMQRGKTPFYSLGQRLSEIRKSLQETVGEVSGAIELDTEVVVRFEKGEERPSEDMLMLLISHFDIKDEEADELWELAGYTQPSQTADAAQIPTLVVVPTDNRIIYTDTANITINNFGVVLNFMQNSTANQSISVARVGMSLQHARSVLEVLAKTIAQAETSIKPKQLPQPKNKYKDQ